MARSLWSGSLSFGLVTVRERRPDLLVSRAGVRFYVEATAVMGDDVWTPQETALADQAYDLINHADVPSFLVDVEMEEFGSSTPSRRDVVVGLEAWLSSLDPDALLAAEAGRAGARGARDALSRLARAVHASPASAWCAETAPAP
jgi:hypothetical protein